MYLWKKRMRNVACQTQTCVTHMSTTSCYKPWLNYTIEIVFQYKQMAFSLTCVCVMGREPLFSCERKKRMDMKSSCIQQRNSSSLCPPVARANSRRDWIIYLKIYSVAQETKRTADLSTERNIKAVYLRMHGLCELM